MKETYFKVMAIFESELKTFEFLGRPPQKLESLWSEPYFLLNKQIHGLIYVFSILSKCKRDICLLFS